MRPTWKAATIVEPLAKVSGSTWVWWEVVFDALQVACVNGSELTVSAAALAAPARANSPTSATPSAAATLRDSKPSDRGISYFLSTTTIALSGLGRHCSLLSG